VQNALVDTGALVALLNRGDAYHAAARAAFAGFRGNLLTTWPVLTEVCHLLPEHLVVTFMRWCANGGVVLFELPSAALSAVTALMESYADRPMDLADASLVWLSGQVGIVDIFTSDNADFYTYRSANGEPFRNLLALPRK